MLARLQPSAIALVQSLVLAGVLLSLTTSTYFLMLDQATEKVVKRFDYGEKRAKRPSSVRPEWRPRVASLALVRAFHTGKREVMADRIAGFFAAGFFATGLLYVLIGRRAAAFLMLGTFAALFYCGTPRAENTWYPWDVPALVFGAATLLLALRRSVLLLVTTTLVAVTFKETLLLMGLFFLFYEGRTLRWRVALAGGTMAAGLLLRAGIERVVGGAVEHANFLHVHGKPEREYRLMDNIHYLFSSELNHVVWANVGLWLIVFFIPARDRVLAGFRWVVLAFYAGLLFAGSYNEFRVFLEVLPGTLLLAYQLFEREPGPARAA
jgi:hypothetical protein